MDEGSKKANELSEEEAEFEEDEEVEREAGSSKSIVESSSAVIIAKGLPDNYMAVHGPVV